jgi:hypothetical protein
MTEQRRARLVVRHRLDGSAAGAAEAARAVVALHASDPATVYLSVLARAAGLDVDAVHSEMYDDRSLVRIMGMRRTLFVVPTDTAPVVHHGAALDVAATMRRRLLKQLAEGPTDPPLPRDVGAWLARLEDRVESFVATHGPVDGATIGAAVPELRTAFLPRTDKKYDVRRTVTSNVLTLVAAEGRIVRGRPLGSWTSRRHTWERSTDWWPDGISHLTPEEARAELVRSYLRAFGPATESDVAWWTGWGLGTTRSAIDAVPTVQVEGGLVVVGDEPDVDLPDPTAALLPALDPTPMGWKERGWFLPEDSSGLYDAYGNVGPTIWWGGEVVGVWAVRADGSVATRLVTDRGREAALAVDDAAARLSARLAGKVVIPAFRTPWERELSAR